MGIGGRSAPTGTGGGPAAAVDVVSIGGTAVSAQPKADGQSNAMAVMEVGARAQFYNGATWDDGRSGASLPVGTFVGYQNSVPYGVHRDVTPVLADGQGAPLLLSASGALVVLVANNVPVTGTVTANQGTPAAQASRWPVGLSDGAAFYDTVLRAQLPAALVGGRLDANVGAWLGSTAPTVGVKAMVDSIPVAIATNQSTIPAVNKADNVNRSATMAINLGTDPDVSWGAAPGNVYAGYQVNKNTTKRYFQFFNKASAPVGGDVPVAEFPLPPAGAAGANDSMVLIGTDFFGSQGTFFSIGIATGYSTTSGTYTAGAAGDQVTGIELT